ncbi:MAG: GNAT family N-acetyltransferase [Sediminibacterium sp.]|nr:GNAT family N-acetyltransferase [Sediminibacterium sp.]
MNIQEILENASLKLYPLEVADFEELYKVASDPAIWEQHPNKNRWKKEVFDVFFEGAIKSKGAYKIVEKNTGEMIGSSRFYDINVAEKSILIGYTFYAKKCWGKGINLAVKKIMLDYIFSFVDTVYFHIGAKNIRSQKAIKKLGAIKIDEIKVAYFGEDDNLNFVYKIEKGNWVN